MTPPEHAIQRIMAFTGMDRMQAINHLRAVEAIRVRQNIGRTA